MVHQVGGAPELGEREAPHRSPGTTLIRVGAASLNPIDLLISAGRHPAGAPRVPHVPGIEGVGRVVESDTVPVGTRVRVTVTGGFVDGTLAELVCAPDAACVPVHPTLADDTAASIGVVGVSALIGLRDRARLARGESVLVLGAAGALGRACVQLARHLGAVRVVAAARDATGRAELADIADATLPLDEDPAAFSRALAEVGGAVDVVVDPLWGPYAAVAVASLAKGGRHLNLGQLAGRQANVDAERLRHGALTLVGHSGSTPAPAQVAAAYREISAVAAEGRLKLPVEVFALDRVAMAWARQAASRGRKVIVRIDSR
jgi:NADPH2:quinone reductase